MVSYACGFHQSETGKYFAWIITAIILLLIIEVSNNWHYPTTDAGRFTSFFAAVRADLSNSALTSQLMQARRNYKYWLTGLTQHALAMKNPYLNGRKLALKFPFARSVKDVKSAWMVFDQTCSQPDESVFILGSEEINVCLILQFEYKFLVDTIVLTRQ